MTRALELHNQSSAFLFRALQAKRKNDFDAYLDYSKQAFALEKEAALELKGNLKAEPTRSVLFRSAATLAISCGQFDEALKLISYALIGNPHEEIKTELFDIIEKISFESQVVEEQTNNAYLEFLREKAINIKINPKTPYYSRAIAVDSILETLKNVKSSISSYIEINFKKAFTQTDFTDFDGVLELVKKDYTPLCVNLKFKSFGASICVDDAVMGKNYNRRILKWKENLFESFKAEVIEIDYESGKAVQALLEKYTDEERNQIYSPIVDSLKEKNKYNVSLTDKNFRTVEKTLRPVSKPTQEKLIPKLTKPPETKDKVLIQSYALSPDPGSFQKKDVFLNFELDYAEFSHQVKEVSFEKEYLVVRNPYQIKIQYKRPNFSVDDSMFEISARADTFDRVVQNYNRSLIGIFRRLNAIENRDLALTDVELKEKLNDTFTFASSS